MASAAGAFWRQPPAPRLRQARYCQSSSCYLAPLPSSQLASHRLETPSLATAGSASALSGLRALLWAASSDQARATRPVGRLLHKQPPQHRDHRTDGLWPPPAQPPPRVWCTLTLPDAPLPAALPRPTRPQAPLPSASAAAPGGDDGPLQPPPSMILAGLAEGALLFFCCAFAPAALCCLARPRPRVNIYHSLEPALCCCWG